VVVGLARGGVPVAHEIAAALRLPLDVCIVRKLGCPFQPELAMGALGPDGLVVWNEDLVHELGIRQDQLEDVIRKESGEILRREKAYRQGRPGIRLAGKTVILVDDGVATGATTLVAVQTLRRQPIERLIVAVGVASREAVGLLRSRADDVVCLLTPDPLMAIGSWYRDFRQVTDAEVQQLLTPRIRPDEPVRGAAAQHSRI
jgi:predicted phosphoribosyltransferase